MTDKVLPFPPPTPDPKEPPTPGGLQITLTVDAERIAQHVLDALHDAPEGRKAVLKTLIARRKRTPPESA